MEAIGPSGVGPIPQRPKHSAKLDSNPTPSACDSPLGSYLKNVVGSPLEKTRIVLDAHMTRLLLSYTEDAA